MTEPQIDFARFVKLVIEALEAAGVDYMIGGAVASWAWGEPRATMDLGAAPPCLEPPQIGRLGT